QFCDPAYNWNRLPFLMVILFADIYALILPNTLPVTAHKPLPASLRFINRGLRGGYVYLSD
uniref:hypothetical protein n=1 Tax=Escherichia coli TaxID=562 RepID=UPI002284B7DE